MRTERFTANYGVDGSTRRRIQFASTETVGFKSGVGISSTGNQKEIIKASGI
jgi:hypothetical protein